MAGFAIKNLTFPKTVVANTDWQVAGQVTLFGLPFYGPLWIVTRVTYPRVLTDLIGPPINGKSTLSLVGKFAVDYPDGFDRQGNYKLEVDVYLGPTTEASAGGITSVSNTIPPLPPVAKVSAQVFAVSGQSSSLGVVLSQPTAVPSPATVGQTVNITCPVVNKSTVDQTVDIEISIYEAGSLGFDGALIDTKDLSGITIKAGATYQAMMANIATSSGVTNLSGQAARHVLVTVSKSGQALVSNHFANVFYVNTTGAAAVSFTIGQPTAAPEVVSPSQTVAITVPVASKLSTAQTATVDIEIYEAGFLWMAGHLIEKKTAQATVSANSIYDVVVQHTATIGGPQNSQGQAWRDVGVVVTIGSNQVAQAQFDNIFGVQIGGAAVSFTLEQPSASPAGVTSGQTVSITCPVVNSSSFDETVTVLIEVKQAGFAFLAGPTLQSWTSQATLIPAGQTKNFTVQHTAAMGGPTDSAGRAYRHVDVTLKVNGQLAPNTSPTNPNEFDNVFYVTSATVASKYKVGDTLQILSNPETFSVISVNSAANPNQYVLQSSNGGSPFALGISFVDSNPDWHIAVPPTVSFTLEQPSASPVGAAVGGVVNVTCPVFNNSSRDEAVVVLIEIKQAGFAFLAGPTLQSWTSPETIIPAGQTTNFTVQHTAAMGGPTDSAGRAYRHVDVTLKVNGQLALNTSPTNPNEFDNVFYVSASAPAPAPAPAPPPAQVSASVLVLVLPAGSGTVGRSPSGPYHEMDVVTLTAMPAAGWSFSHWDINGNLYDTSPWTTTLIDPTTNVTAYFVQGPAVIGPQFPAPGTVGDGSYWFWIVFTDGSSGWFNANVYDQIDPATIDGVKTKGPFASGATS